VFDGQPVEFASVRDASAQGIGLSHQELQLFPDLSVAENMFVGREHTTRLGTIDTVAHEREARAVLRRLGQDIDPAAQVGRLPLGRQQIVEIARALVADTRVLMMDEPTSALTVGEIRSLFLVIRELAARGVAIVYISHHLHELLEIADRVTVLRDGVTVGEGMCRNIDLGWIVERMTGRTPDARPVTPASSVGQVVLDVRDLCLPGAPGRTALEHVTLQMRAGEVLGLYGLLGSGRTELFETLLGLHAGGEGGVSLDGRPLAGRDVHARVRAGVAMVPEDRQAAGLVQSLTVQQNMTLSSLPAIAPAGLLRPEAERRESAALADRLRVRTAGLDAPVTSLSGGNQQKVVIARGVMAQPRVLLLDDPTRGVDVAAKAEILRTMRSLAAQGMAVAFASSDLTEILDGADRILVMARGRVRGEFRASDVTKDTLAAAASAAPSGDDGGQIVVH
jgi:erythritol transport system ATP-binding protein